MGRIVDPDQRRVNKMAEPIYAGPLSEALKMCREDYPNRSKHPLWWRVNALMPVQNRVK